MATKSLSDYVNALKGTASSILNSVSPTTTQATQPVKKTASGSISGSWTGPQTETITNNSTGATTTTQLPYSGMATPPSINVTTPEYDMQKYIDQLAESQRKSKIAALDKAKTNALTNLDTEKANIEPEYYNKRNQAQVRNDVGAMNFAQYMAARGIKGNAGAMPEIYRNASLQGQIGALDQSEAHDFANIERQRSNINNGYEADVANANADIESQKMQNYIEQWNKNRDYNLNLGQLTGAVNGAPTLAGKQFAYNVGKDTQERADTYANNLGYAINPTANTIVPQDIRDRIKNSVDTQFGGDYSSYIAANPQDESYGTALRNEKIYSNLPEYGQYIPKTLEGINAGLQNKKAELDIASQEIENSYLPDTLKLQARRLQQQVDTGALDYDTALAQLNKLKIDNQYLPQKYQADINQSNASAASASALASKRSSSGGDLSKTEQKNLDMSGDYDALKSKSVSEAISLMNNRWGNMVAKYGPDGAKQLWNSVLYDAIQEGQAQAR